jgi:glycosyltransferase involved in cell wall biosynthesis
VRLARGPGRVLIIVQNLPVPLDRRVWLECRTLVEAGHQVSVVCPKGPGDPSRQVIEGVTIYKYQPYAPGGGAMGFVAEYIYSFAMTAWLVAKAWRHERFDVLQACNPPDIFWPLGIAFRALGCSFVFDHHDLCPELYESRFPGGPRPLYRCLRALEWMTFRSATHVIATNESYRRVALRRGGKKPDEVTVVRTGPDAARLRRVDPDPALRQGRQYLVAYIGVMGPQDGVDIVLHAADLIVHGFGRDDVTFVLMGHGDSFDDLVALRDRLGLAPYVEFTGRVPDGLVATVLSTADVGLSPDPRNPLNELSTMNKTMEYMAYELPVVAFDLAETRVSAQGAAVYVEPNEVDRYAKAVVELLLDEPLRRRMGALGRARVEDELAWDHQRPRYRDLYSRLLAERA